MLEIWWFQIVSLLGIVILIFPGGTIFCKKITERFRGSSKDSPSETMPTSADLQKAGRVIGYFERFIIVAAMQVDSWEMIAVVIALKTAARYKDLDNKIPAEYFLIGSLASLSWALAWGWALKKQLFLFALTGA